MKTWAISYSRATGDSTTQPTEYTGSFGPAYVYKKESIQAMSIAFSAESYTAQEGQKLSVNVFVIGGSGHYYGKSVKPVFLKTVGLLAYEGICYDPVQTSISVVVKDKVTGQQCVASVDIIITEKTDEPIVVVPDAPDNPDNPDTPDVPEYPVVVIPGQEATDPSNDDNDEPVYVVIDNNEISDTDKIIVTDDGVTTIRKNNNELAIFLGMFGAITGLNGSAVTGLAAHELAPDNWTDPEKAGLAAATAATSFIIGKSIAGSAKKNQEKAFQNGFKDGMAYGARLQFEIVQAMQKTNNSSRVTYALPVPIQGSKKVPYNVYLEVSE
ncbi:MAG: hypothetical protein KAS17_10205 [Victivallaceae bacterium]|nr:hypothetical protein [Victivallaceae bacterium]